jgi:hypothetical protein
MAKPKKGVVPAALKRHLFTKKSGGAKKSNATKPAFLMKSAKMKSGRKR